MVAKSGCPVFGQRQVNSGQSIEITKFRPGRGWGKVSRLLLGFVAMPSSGSAAAAARGGRGRDGPGGRAGGRGPGRRRSRGGRRRGRRRLRRGGGRRLLQSVELGPQRVDLLLELADRL